MYSLDRKDDVNQESYIAVTGVGLGVNVEIVVSGNVTHFDQFMRLYCDNKHLSGACTIKSVCMHVFTRP